MIGVSIIGCGLIGTKRAHALPEEMQLISVFDNNVERAKALASSFNANDVLVADSVDGAIAAGDVQLVIIATPHDQLPKVAMQALEAGCNVLIEKPGADRVEPLIEVRKLAAKSGKMVRVGFNHRFHPSFQKVRALLSENDYGPLINVRARYGHGGRLGYEKEWRAVKAISGGGELIDQGLHLIDLTRFLVGDVELAFAELRTDFWNMPVEDNAYLALRPKAGGFAWLHASWTEWKNTFSFEISFRDVKFEVFGLGGSYGTERLTMYEMSPELGPPATTSWEWPMADKSWQTEMQDVLKQLNGASSAGASIDDAVAALQIAKEAYSA